MLGPRHINVNVTGGVATFEAKEATGTWDNQFAAGFEARIRAGLRGKQEIGASLIGGMGTAVANGDSPFVVGGKLSYKFAPLQWLAFVAGVGAMHYTIATVAPFSADVAVIVAPYPSPDRALRRAEGCVVVPVLQDRTNVQRQRGDHLADRCGNSDQRTRPRSSGGWTHRPLRSTARRCGIELHQ